jgi:hypothetical protein
MCQYNLAIIDSDSDDLKLKEVFEQNNLHYSVIKVTSFDDQSGKVYKIVLTAGNNCDCGSVIGSETRHNSPTIRIERDIKKLKQKNWSDNKIKRYLENKQKADSIKIGESGEELEKWNKTIQYCLNNYLTKRFGILTHYFSESHSEEKFDNIVINRTKLKDFKLEELKKVEFDKILLIEFF